MALAPSADTLFRSTMTGGASDHRPAHVTMATSSEETPAVVARKVLEADGVGHGGASTARMECIDARRRSYRRDAIPPGRDTRVLAEHVGAGADDNTVSHQSGFTTEAVVEAGRRTLNRAQETRRSRARPLQEKS